MASPIPAQLGRLLKRPVTIGIRREDPSRIWERRCPLTPRAVEYLVKELKAKVLVQNCERRVFHIDEFIKAGAHAQDDLRSAHIVVGIKETPISELDPLTAPVRSSASKDMTYRTHFMFSHTTKGQPYNMGLLSRFIAGHEKNAKQVSELLPRLVDYELLTESQGGKRTVGFGWFAGVAGVLESLSSMAHYHLEIGIASPFLYTPRPHTLPSLSDLRNSMRQIGATIAAEGTPKRLGPVVIGLTGTGNVAEGCLSILSDLGPDVLEHISVTSLARLVTNPGTDLTKIYLVHAKPEDYLSRLDGQPYSRSDYYANPSAYKSDFASKVAPFLTLFLNGAGWSPSYPRLMTNTQLETALQKAQSIGGARFTNIGDISCDVEGGLQFLTQSTTLSSPFYKTRPSTLPASLPSVQIMSVDILPASIPLDASNHFSEKLMPYLETIIQMYAGAPTESRVDEAAALYRATVATNGRLTDLHRGLSGEVDKWRDAEATRSLLLDGITVEDPALGLQKKDRLSKKRILLLGSGMVSGPAIEEITRRHDIELLVASNSVEETKRLIQNFPNIQSRIVDMAQLEDVSALIEEADLVISLLPAGMHPAIANLCIQHRKHLVTASYISPAMRALHEKAVAADVLLLNEIGLDPGIDHCSAISLLNGLKDKNVASFISFCGGLPAPECSSVPLRYKFSWSPRGVLTAALNGARYRLWDKEFNVAPGNVLHRPFTNLPISTDLELLEGIPNRDSLLYAEIYGMKGLRTLLRGTLRYPGYSALMQSFVSLGLLETEKTIVLKSWPSLIQQCLLTRGIKLGSGDAVKDVIKGIIDPAQVHPLIEALTWLSLDPNTDPASTRSSLFPSLPSGPTTPMDLFSHLLAYQLRYNPNERDMVILHHEIIVRNSNSKPTRGEALDEIHTSTLVTFGTPKASAMSRTVGLPVAFAALKVLDGGVRVRGVAGPEDPSIYRSVLQQLEEAGLGMTDSTRHEKSLESILLPMHDM